MQLVLQVLYMQTKQSYFVSLEEKCCTGFWYIPIWYIPVSGENVISWKKILNNLNKSTQKSS